MAVINTNAKALFSQAALKSTDRSMSVAMQQLSTGKRINSARDDAAGLSIATRMTHQIRSLNQAVRNAGDAINLIQTAEGATNEITDMMQRMRELAVQAVNDTNNNADRSYLDLEFQQLKQQIVQIADNTEWNGFPVLNGKAGEQVGEMPVYKVTSENQFGSVFIQPTTTRTLTGSGVGEIQKFNLIGATPALGKMSIAGVDVDITASENTIAKAAQKIASTLNSSETFATQGMSAVYTGPTMSAVTASPAVTETTEVTFKALTVGQSVTVAGLTLTAAGNLTAAEIATAFSTGNAPANGRLSGALTAVTAGGATNDRVTFTSTTQNGNVAAITAAASAIVNAPAAPTVAITTAGANAVAGPPAVAAIADVVNVTFTALTRGQSVAVGPVQFTALEDVTAAQVAGYFSGVVANAPPANPSTGLFTTIVPGTVPTKTYTASNAPGSTVVTFTATSTGVATNALTAAVTGTAAATAISSSVTDGVAAAKVTFTDMYAGQTVTIAGKTFTASANVTGAQVASFFATPATAPGANGTIGANFTDVGVTTAAATTDSAELVFKTTTVGKTFNDLAVTSNFANFEIKYNATQGDVPAARVLVGSTGLTPSTVETTRYALTNAVENFAEQGKFIQSGEFKFNVPSGLTAGAPVTATFVNDDGESTELTATLSSTNPAIVKFAVADGRNSAVISKDLTYTLRNSNGEDINLATEPRAVSVSVGVEGSIPKLRDGDLLINGVNVGESLASDDVLSPRNNAAGSAIAKAAAINRVAVDQGISQGEIQAITFSGTPMPGTITVGGVSVVLTNDDNTAALAAGKIAAAMQASPLYDSSTGRTVKYAAGSAVISVDYPTKEGNVAKLEVQPGSTGLGSVVNTIQQFATKVPGTGVFAKVNENIFNGQAMKGGPVATGVVFINGYASANITTVYNNSQATRENVVRAINLISDKTGVRAIDTGSDDKGISLVAVDGRNIEVRFEPTGSTDALTFGQRIGVREGVQSATISLESKIQAPVVLSSDATGDITRSGLIDGNYSKNQAVLNSKPRDPVAASVAQVGSVKVVNTTDSDDTVSVVINGTSFSATAAIAGGGTPQQVTSKLVDLINANSTLGVFATKGREVGEILLTARTPGVAFTMTASTNSGSTVSVATTEITANKTADYKSLGMDDLEINGVKIRPTTPLDDKFSNTIVSSSDPASSGIALAAAINASTNLTGVKALANPVVSESTVTSTETPISGMQSVYVNGIEIKVNFEQNESGTDRRAKVVAAINERTGQHGVTASDNGKGVTLTTDGRNLSVWIDSSQDELSAADFGLSKGGEVAQQSKVKVAAGSVAVGSGDKASIMINGVTVETEALAANATPADITSALIKAVNATESLKNITAKVDPADSTSLIITSNVAGSAFDLRSPAIKNSIGNYVSSVVMTLSTIQENNAGLGDVSTIDLSDAYKTNVLGSANAPLSAMNIKTLYGTVRLTSDAPILPALPGADGLPPNLMNISGKPIQIRAGADGFGSMSNFMALGFNEGSFGGRASADMDPPRVGRMAFQVGSSANQVITIDLADFGKNGGITGEITGDVDLPEEARRVRIHTRDGATAVLNLLDSAMDKVNATRATMGAVMNRLDHVINNLTNVSMNMSASRSQIEDSDYAQASTELAKTQIMQQAATAVLAQANTSQQSVMKLLGG